MSYTQIIQPQATKPHLELLSAYFAPKNKSDVKAIWDNPIRQQKLKFTNGVYNIATGEGFSERIAAELCFNLECMNEKSASFKRISRSKDVEIVMLSTPDEIKAFITEFEGSDLKKKLEKYRGINLSTSHINRSTNAAPSEGILQQQPGVLLAKRNGDVIGIAYFNTCLSVAHYDDRKTLKKFGGVRVLPYTFYIDIARVSVLSSERKKGVGYSLCAAMVQVLDNFVEDALSAKSENIVSLDALMTGYAVSNGGSRILGFTENILSAVGESYEMASENLEWGFNNVIAECEFDY